MKRIPCLFILFTLAILCRAQNFEGIVVYQNTYKSKMPGATDEQFTKMMGDKEEYYIKNGNYKLITNGSLAQWELYLNNENRLYSKLSNSETVFWNDAGENDDSVILFSMNKEITEVLGYKCDEVSLLCKNGTERYYFNSSLHVDAKLFAKHKYGNWNEYLKKANAVPLKIIINNPQYTLESIATEVKKLPLEDNLFQLPDNSKTEKSRFK
jgi:hypothetical protein